MKDATGRTFIAMHEVRGGLVTANASITTGTATSLISGDADKFLDIVEISFANNSTVGAHVNIVNDGTTIRGVDVPLSGTVQLCFDTPLKQITKNTPWNIDMDDITGTTVMVGATLIKTTND